MKKLLLLTLSVFMAGTSFGAYSETPVSVNTASFTITNDTTKQLPGTKPGDILEVVAVSSATGVAGGVLTIYDGQGTNATNVIAKVALTNIQFVPFFVRVSSGITYTTAGNSQSGVTMIYRVR